MASAVPGFKKALTARLAADAALNGNNTVVSQGHPHPNRLTSEWVYIGDMSERKLAWTAGMGQANEGFLIPVMVSVIGSVMQAQETLNDRAWVLADAVQASVMSWADTGYSGAATIVLPADGKDEEALDGDTREASVTLVFSVTARIEGG